MQCSAVQCSAVQWEECSAVQCSAVQRSAVGGVQFACGISPTQGVQAVCPTCLALLQFTAKHKTLYSTVLNSTAMFCTVLDCTAL